MLTASNYRSTFANQREILKMKFQDSCIFCKHGGTFELSPVFLMYVKSILDDGETSAILVDKKEVCILVDDLEDFYDDVKGEYKSAINEYYYNMEQLKKKRNIGKVLEN